MKTNQLTVLCLIIGILCSLKFTQRILTINSFYQDQDTVITYKSDSLTDLTLKTISITKSRTFLWFKLNHHRLIVKDEIYKDRKLIIEATSKFICSMDACKTIRFNRFIINEGKIIKIKFSDKTKNGLRTEYNLLGKQINSIRLGNDLLIIEFSKKN